jgi:hypothetical protein
MVLASRESFKQIIQKGSNTHVLHTALWSSRLWVRMTFPLLVGRGLCVLATAAVCDVQEPIADSCFCASKVQAYSAEQKSW